MLVVIYRNGDIYIGRKEFYLDSKSSTIRVGDKTTDLSEISTIIAGDPGFPPLIYKKQFVPPEDMLASPKQ